MTSGGFQLRRWDSSDRDVVSRRCSDLDPRHRHFFLLSEKDADLVPVIQAQAAASAVSVSGALFPALIAEGQIGVNGCIVMEMGEAPPPIILENASEESNMESNAARMTEYVRSLPQDRPASLFCVFDALIPNTASQLDLWYLHVADRVQLFGVNAGSENFTPFPCLFDGVRTYQDAILLQLLPDHPGAFLEHGYPAPAEFLTATSAEGNKIIQIDWQPALNIYAQVMLERKGLVVNRENFYSFAVHFPFGIIRADGEVLVRIPVALTDDGSIYCIGEIPPNSLLALLDAAAGSADAPALLAKSLNSVSKSEDLLLFYCAGRRMHRKMDALKELEEIHSLCHARQTLGALSLGEIGSSRQSGYPLFHNATLVGVPCR